MCCFSIDGPPGIYYCGQSDTFPLSLPFLPRICQCMPGICKAYFSSSSTINVLAFIQQVK